MKQIGILVLFLSTYAAAQAQTWVNPPPRGTQHDEFSPPPTYKPSYGQERRSPCSRNAFGNRAVNSFSQGVY